jgi:hypothetical protein
MSEAEKAEKQSMELGWWALPCLAFLPTQEELSKLRRIL